MFSWTDVLNQFETTLPATVRISSVRPRVERDGTMMVDVVVLARTVEAVDAFIENLEKRGAFSGVLSREEFVNEDGLIQASIQGRYRPAAERGGQGGRAMTSGLRRVFLERRAVILPLAVALLVNAAIFGLVVYPSSGRVARAEQQEQAALRELGDGPARIRRGHAHAAGQGPGRRGPRRSSTTTSCPPTWRAHGGPRTCTSRSWPGTRDSSISAGWRNRASRGRATGTRRRRWRASTSRWCSRATTKGVRQFLRDVEASDGFIVIDNIGLAEGTDRSSALVLTVELSTYYRAATRAG